jgi:hypothetical protein
MAVIPALRRPRRRVKSFEASQATWQYPALKKKKKKIQVLATYLYNPRYLRG